MQVSLIQCYSIIKDYFPQVLFGRLLNLICWMNHYKVEFFLTLSHLINLTMFLFACCSLWLFFDGLSIIMSVSVNILTVKCLSIMKTICDIIFKLYTHDYIKKTFQLVRLSLVTWPLTLATRQFSHTILSGVPFANSHLFQLSCCK